MQSWVAAIHHVTFQLEEIQVNIPNEDIILVLTAGLPSSYEALIVSFDLLPAVNYLFKQGKAYSNLMDVVYSPWGNETKRKRETWGWSVVHSKDSKNRWQ